jgi:hypothetical protein
MRELQLPGWARVREGASDKFSVSLAVDSASAYREWLTTLGVTEVDQYWLEVAYQCIKIDLQAALVGTAHDPRTCGKPSEFRFSKSEEHALADKPEGKGIVAATQGKEARGHYVRLRGAMPF